ncbi:porin [Bosea sp. ASV33]|uniref:porin n=1 Tax=Bosea sp. ASV33 TaxID=2795106 RepID=UPI0018ED1F98|nr:porin [Bosea sp. ASV33]
MKLVKSLLLGSAAGIAAVAGAQAADLPSRKAAPVEYVRVCSAFGAGFFYIPGTDTCLRVGGRVRAEYIVQQKFNGVGLDTQDQYGMRARGRIYIDARNQTAYGTLRTFVRLDTTVSTGSYNQGTNGSAPAFSGQGGITNAGIPGASGTSSNLDRAFVQFGPLTAGRSQSFFDFYADALNYGPIRGSDNVVNLLAYTATFGSGFSATLALEDSNEHRVGNVVVSPGSASNGQPNVGNFIQGGSDYPDLVGSLNVAQGWGSAQLSGAVFQRKTIASTGFGSGDKTGFALQAGVKINLPMLAAGDELWLQAAYAEGGISYLGYGGNSQGSTWSGNTNVGRLLIANSDANIDVFGSMKLTKGYALTAGFLHYWTPTIRQAVYGSYSKLDYSNNIGALGNVGLDPEEWRVGSNLIWSPVAGLDIGVEVLYANARVKSFVQAAGRPVGVLTKSDDSFQGRLRVQRDF